MWYMGFSYSVVGSTDSFVRIIQQILIYGSFKCIVHGIVYYHLALWVIVNSMVSTVIRTLMSIDIIFHKNKNVLQIKS